MKPIPFLLFGREWWEKVVNWQLLADAGVISPEDLTLFAMVETAEEAVSVIDGWGVPG
jgi:predicted Rossmann-fold nucleotide-binding protein